MYQVAFHRDNLICKIDFAFKTYTSAVFFFFFPTVPAAVEDGVVEDTIGALVPWHVHHQWHPKQLSVALSVALVCVLDLFNPVGRGRGGGARVSHSMVSIPYEFGVSTCI